MTEENKATVRRFWQETDKLHRPLTEILAPNFAISFSGGPPMNTEAFSKFAGGFYAAFPDLTHTIDDIVSEGEKVAIRMTLRGTHKGDLMGLAPTGKKILVSAQDIYRVVDGKISQGYAVVDQMGLMQQLGAIPPSPS